MKAKPANAAMKLFESVVNDPTPRVRTPACGGLVTLEHPEDWAPAEDEGLLVIRVPQGRFMGSLRMRALDLKAEEDLTPETMPGAFAHVASSIFDPTYKGEIPVNSLKNGNWYIRYDELLRSGKIRMKSVHFMIARAAAPRRMVVADIEYWHPPELEKDLRVQRGLIMAELIAWGAELPGEPQSAPPEAASS